jgi:hypothetical protein
MMRRFSVVIAIAISCAAIMAACGGDTAHDSRDNLAGYFPDRIEQANLEKVSDIRTFVGDSLWEYINGGAELYHTYGFAKVSTADYRSGDVDLVLDLYQFATSDGAYGLYSMLRPDEPELVTLGVEGYFTGSSLEFVRGKIMARIVGYDDSEATGAAIRRLAEHLASALPGTTQWPAMFSVFPVESAIANTDKIVGQGFLGQSFLSMVYTRDYNLPPDTLTLFIMDDPNGVVLAEWFGYVSEEEKSPVSLVDMPFDENYSLLISNAYYGDILAGLKGGKLAGVINFSDQHFEFVSRWLGALSGSSEVGGH